MATYYVKSTGSDSNSGLSDALAWKTISKVNSQTFSPGDNILFNCGDIWREELDVPSSGNSSNYIVFGKYGTGNLPQIIGSQQSSGWTNTSGNIWQSTTTFSTNPYSANTADIIFIDSNDIKHWGAYKTSTGNLAAEYDWTYSSSYIYVYSATDPSLRYSGIEVPQRFVCIDTLYNEYLSFQDLEFHYATGIGIDSYSRHSDHLLKYGCTIERCKVSYIGGVSVSQAGFGFSPVYSNLIIRDCSISQCGRRGISLDTYGYGFTSTNALIEKNTLFDGWHTTGVDINSGNGSYTSGWDGIIIRRNIFAETNPTPNSQISNQIFLQNYDYNSSSGGHLYNIYIYSNIFKYPTGTAINSEGVNSVYIYNNTFFEVNSGENTYSSQLWIDANNSSLKYKNNIFYVSANSRTGNYGTEVYTNSYATSNIIRNNNIFYRISNSLDVLNTNTIYYMNTLTTWESSALAANPQFVDSSGGNLSLMSTSPAKYKGENLALPVDFYGNPFNNPPSLGAIEMSVGTNYYVKNAGSDSNDGLSDNTAWKTISKVNSQTFSPGDTILFNCGDTWRETLEVPSAGTSDSYISFMSYGTGANPKIIGSKATTTWTNTSGNIWKTTITFSDPQSFSIDGADIIFNKAGVERYGNYVSGTGSLAAEYDWTWASNYIYVYSTTDPATTYTAIEVQQRAYGVSTNDNSYLHFSNIDVAYCGATAYDSNNDHVVTDQHGIIIENCEIKFIGGITGVQSGYGIAITYSNATYRNNTFHNCGRRAISINCQAEAGVYTVHDVLIERNTFYNGAHTTSMDLTVNNQGNSASINGLIFRRNLVYGYANMAASYGDNLIWMQRYAGTATLTNVYIYANIFKWPRFNAIGMEGLDGHIYIYNNTFYNNNAAQNGYSYFIYQDTDRGTAYVYIKNNIFYTNLSEDNLGDGMALYNYVNKTYWIPDYNCYYRINNSLRVWGGNGSFYTLNQRTTVTSALGWESANTLTVDPLFTDPENGDFSLQSTSTAKSAGTPLADVTTDFFGNPFNATAPSMGAIQYGAASATIPTVTTSSVTDVSINTATCGGNVTYDGSSNVTSRGVCWNTSGTPTISDTYTSDGTGTGAFTSSITGLLSNTTYYVRAYATNSIGTGYGSVNSFTTSSSSTPPSSSYKYLYNSQHVFITYNGKILFW